MWCHHMISPLQSKTKTCMEPKVGVQLSSGVQAGYETVPCAWLGDTRFWVWRVGPLRKKWTNCLESEGEGVLPENNLREVKSMKWHENKQWDCWHPDFAWMRIANGFLSKQDHLTCILGNGFNVGYQNLSWWTSAYVLSMCSLFHLCGTFEWTGFKLPGNLLCLFGGGQSVREGAHKVAICT